MANFPLLLLLALGAFSVDSLVIQRGDHSINFPDPEIGLRAIQVPRLGPINRVYYFSSFVANYNDAVEYCLSTKRHLLMIKDDLKEEEVRTAIAKDRTHEDRWIWIDYNNPGWVWGDGTRALFTNFYESSSSPGFKHYVEGNASAPYFNKWRYTKQDYELYFVCEGLDD